MTIAFWQVVLNFFTNGWYLLWTAGSVFLLIIGFILSADGEERAGGEEPAGVLGAFALGSFIAEFFASRHYLQYQMKKHDGINLTPSLFVICLYIIAAAAIAIGLASSAIKKRRKKEYKDFLIHVNDEKIPFGLAADNAHEKVFEARSGINCVKITSLKDAGVTLSVMSGGEEQFYSVYTKGLLGDWVESKDRKKHLQKASDEELSKQYSKLVNLMLCNNWEKKAILRCFGFNEQSSRFLNEDMLSRISSIKQKRDELLSDEGRLSWEGRHFFESLFDTDLAQLSQLAAELEGIDAKGGGQRKEQVIQLLKHIEQKIAKAVEKEVESKEGQFERKIETIKNKSDEYLA